ncbi:MAG: SMP-30/gluconolactonase/LRE family protein [Gemmatimonadota bacterium]
MATPELVARDLVQPYGLAFDTEEVLFVAESGAGRVSRVRPDGKPEVFAETGGRPMGIAFDDSGDLFVAESGRHHLLLISPDEEVEVYASQCHGRRLVAPRDLCFEPTGSALFSDGGKEDGGGAVYRADLDGEVEELFGGLSMPAGMVLTEDAGGLYVAEDGASRILYVELGADGGVTEPQVLVEFGDGHGVATLLMDAQGNLLASRPGAGVSLIDPEGAVVQSFAVPGGQLTGMTFGGLEFDQLFIAAAGAGTVYRIQLDRPGQRPFAGPRAV